MSTAADNGFAAQLAAANSAEGGGTNADPFDEVKMDSAIEASSVLNLLPSDLRKPHDQMRLGACLQAFGAPEALQGDNAYVCEACEKAAKERGEKPTGQPALKWLQLSSVPRKLTLHLKRFRSTGRRTHKLDEHVPFPARFDIGPFTCAAGAPVKHYSHLSGGGAPSAGMRLYGVIEHEGSFDGGHYISYVRLQGGSQWYRMSDSIVKEVSEEVVLSKQAFMLFYERE